MSDDLKLVLQIVGQDSASATLRAVTESLASLDKQAKKTSETLKRSLGADVLKPLSKVRAESQAFGADLTEAADKAAKALRGDVLAVAELRTALRGAVAEQRAFADAVKASQAAGATAARSQATAARNAATGRATATADDLRGWRTRQRIKAASERAESADLRRKLSAGRTLLDIRRRTEAAELRSREGAGNAWTAAQRRKLSIMDRSAAVEGRRQREADRVEAAKARAESVATDRRVGNVARIWRMRERSEAAEARHLSTMRRERDAMRRSAMGAGRHAYSHARHALRSVNHPAFESAGFWVTAGAAFGIEAGRHLLESARNIDAAATRFRMMPGVSAEDSAEVRARALREGMRIGLDPAEVVRLQLQGLRDGLSKDIAASLPAVVNAAVQTMGGNIDRDGDELAKAVREATTVGWVKNAAGARSLMNSVAGLSTFNGNSPEKMQQFLASGGIGRGKELGWTKDQTLAFGAALNGSGERTGLGSARLMAQIPEIRAQMRDRFTKALESNDYGEEVRAVRSAPRVLQYSSIRDMQQSFDTPEGVTDFLSRLSQVPEQQRAAIEKGYGLGPQFNAVAAEMGADNGHRYHEAYRRQRELSAQNADDDDLSKNSKTWSGSIDFMVGQLKASVSAVQSELGDVIKDDILAPFTGWWVTISEALLDGSMKADLHKAISGFIEGLGFSDLTAALDALRGSIGTFDFAGFMRGIGEGVRAVMDNVRRLASAFGGAGGMDARTVGKLAAELFGLSIALHVVAPFVTLIGGIASGFLAIKAAVEGVAIVARLTGLADGLRAIVGVELAATAGGLLSLAGGLTAIGAAVQALLSAGVLNPIHLPKDMSGGEWDRFVWGSKPDGTSARPAWVDKLIGGSAKPGDGLVKGPHGGLMPAPQGFKPTAHEGGEDRNNWRNLLQRASYEPSNAEAIARDATVDTARGVVQVREAVDRLSVIMRTATLSGSGSASVAGFGGGGGEGGGNANLRYGRGAAGGYRSTPGTGSYGNPSKSLLDLIAKSEGAGYNVSWGNGRFLPGGHEQNLTGKSLNEILALGDVMRRQPGARNSSALGRYQITGSTLRDLMHRMGLNGSEKFDEAMQDRLASKLISDEGPRALGRWEGLKRGGRMAEAQALLRSGSIASQPGDTSFNGAGGGNAGAAVDKALSMQGMGEGSAARELHHYMHSGEWCADFVNGALGSAGVKGTNSAMARSFSTWGHHVGFGDVRKGDVITERHGDHVGHVGLATGNVQRDRNGNVTAVEMVSGNYGNLVKRNWEKVGIIADLRRSDQAIAETARKVGTVVAPSVKAPAPADIARKVPTNARPRPGADVRPQATTADASQSGSEGGRAGGGHTINMAFHHQVTDHEQHARAVGREVDRVLADRSHDIDHFNV